MKIESTIAPFNPGDPVNVRGMPEDKIYLFQSIKRLPGQEDYAVLTINGLETQWPISSCILLEKP